MSCEGCKGVESEVMYSAADHIKNQRKKIEIDRLKIICLTAFASVAVICAAVVACFAIYTQQQTIIEQQCALNMQYAALTDLLSGAEITTETENIDGSDGGIAAKIEGDNNSIGGGD